MKALFLAAVSAAALALLAPPAEAISRHCDARYFWETTGGSIGGSFNVFRGRGGCGASVPNRCRERARDNILRCARTHWDLRWDRSRPELCLAPSGVLDYDTSYTCQRVSGHSQCFDRVDGAANPRPVRVVRDGDIKGRLEAAVCCQHGNGRHDFRDNRNVHVRLSVVSRGDDRCAASATLTSDYRIDCDAVRRSICSP